MVIHETSGGGKFTLVIYWYNIQVPRMCKGTWVSSTRVIFSKEFSVILFHPLHCKDKRQELKPTISWNYMSTKTLKSFIQFLGTEHRNRRIGTGNTHLHPRFAYWILGYSVLVLFCLVPGLDFWLLCYFVILCMINHTIFFSLSLFFLYNSHVTIKSDVSTYIMHL